MSEERIEMVKNLAKKSDIYERLARAIGKNIDKNIYFDFSLNTNLQNKT